MSWPTDESEIEQDVILGPLPGPSLPPLLAVDPAEHALLLGLAEEAARLRQELLASRDWPQWARFCAALDALAAFREANHG